MMAQVFAPAEQAAVAATPADRRAEAFFKCWTSKEAYIKGLGDGLAIPLRSFEVCVDPARPARLLRPYEAAPAGAAWSLHDVRALPLGYAATLAAAGPQRIAVVELAAPG
jgi:4'-phosphopantetheinyl transferase